MNDTVIKSSEDLIKVLGWCVWGIGCVWLLLNLSALRKKKGRPGRALVCLSTATGLVVTLFTSFSKFHLLWIMMLPLMPSLVVLCVAVPVLLVYHKIKQRRPKTKTLPAQSYPPFETLQWEHDGWEGRIKLPAWVGFQSRGGAYGSSDSASPSDGSVAVNMQPANDAKELTPSEAQCRAMRYHIEQGEAVVQSVLSALLPHYRRLKFSQSKRDRNFSEKLLPSASSSEVFRELIGLSRVHVLPYESEGMAYVGLEFGCEWEDEHGLGVVTHGARVVAIEDAQIAFSWQPEETAKPTS